MTQEDMMETIGKVGGLTDDLFGLIKQALVAINAEDMYEQTRIVSGAWMRKAPVRREVHAYFMGWMAGREGK